MGPQATTTEPANGPASNGTHQHENGDPATNMASTKMANGLVSHGTHHHENGDAATNMASTAKRYPETGITVLIVGSGIGGLMSALECWRKGHSIQILERSAGPVYTGELRVKITNSCQETTCFFPLTSEG